MSSVLAFQAEPCPPDVAPVPAPPEPVPSAELEALRAAARCVRSAARLDLFRACAMLGDDRHAATRTAAEALVRTLDQGLGRRARLYRPGTPALSFDERWLSALIDAIRREDGDSMAFLLHSRILPHARRATGFLTGRVAMGLDAV